MTSKKTAGSKRTALPRASDHTNRFAKDWDRLAASGRYEMNRLKEVMLLLIANDHPLGPEWLDHALKGKWADHRECHIGGDFLLIYQLQGTGNHEILSFVRAGTHAELFE
jgi:mRNA interferase YafQ